MPLPFGPVVLRGTDDACAEGLPWGWRRRWYRNRFLIWVRLIRRLEYAALGYRAYAPPGSLFAAETRSKACFRQELSRTRGHVAVVIIISSYEPRSRLLIGLP